MKEILKINYDGERPTVSGRDLHTALDVGTAYKDWFPRMCEFGFTEKIDFNPLKFEQVQYEGKRKVTREIIDHQLTIPMAKEIAMLQRNEKGKQVRQYFLQIEENWNRPEMVLARANRIQERMLEEVNQKVFFLETENAALKPKAEFFDTVADAQNAITFSEAARLLGIQGIGQNNLFRMLREKRILMSNNMPYQEFMDRGYFRVIEQIYEKRDGTIMTSPKTLIEQRGLDFIRRALQKEGLLCLC